MEDDDDDFRYSLQDNSSTPLGKEIDLEHAFNALTTSDFSDSQHSDETPIDDSLLVSIEEFLLPSVDNFYYNDPSQDNLEDLLPMRRLEHVMLQTTIAEYVRSMQCLYMDTEDELMLCKSIRMSVEGMQMRLSTQQLMEKITEGRARILALIKLNYGLSSHLRIRSVLDLANSYALQGLWEQVSEYVKVAAAMLQDPAFRYSAGNTVRMRLEARLVCIVHSCIRDHSILNNGQITESLVNELQKLLAEEISRFQSIRGDSQTHSDRFSSYPNEIIDSVKDFLVQTKFGRLVSTVIRSLNNLIRTLVRPGPLPPRDVHSTETVSFLGRSDRSSPTKLSSHANNDALRAEIDRSTQLRSAQDDTPCNRFVQASYPSTRTAFDRPKGNYPGFAHSGWH